MTDYEEESPEILFLTFEEIDEIHKDQLSRYGGAEGYINRHLIESAVESPKAMMYGQFLYEDIADMASVYLYQISESQGFTDGNKRTGAVATHVFLGVNGYDIRASDDEFFDLALRVSQKQMNRKGIAAWIRDRIEEVKDTD